MTNHCLMQVVSLLTTPWGVLVPCLAELTCAKKIFRRQYLTRLTPRNRPPLQKKRLGKMLAHQIKVMHDDHDSPPLILPVLDERYQVGKRPGVDSVEWFVKQDEIGILH